MLDHLLKHPTGLFHLTTALAALIFGIRIIFTAKGTLKHRWLGWGYLGSMILLNCSALLSLAGPHQPVHVDGGIPTRLAKTERLVASTRLLYGRLLHWLIGRNVCRNSIAHTRLGFRKRCFYQFHADKYTWYRDYALESSRCN
jgi:hypothetical protein